ncbi:MAG: ribosomal protein S18-alanine N-acetyltransferase [Armatimonadota bacterium]
MDDVLTDIQLTRMTMADVAQVHRLECLCFPSPWDLEAYQGEIGNPSAYYVVAKQDELIIGFGGMWAVGEEAHVVTLAVDPEYRRHRLGRRLMEALMQEARRRGASLVTLEVRVGNRPALGLYASLGFHVVGYRRGYYPDNGEDAAVMAVELHGRE